MERILLVLVIILTLMAINLSFENYYSKQAGGLTVILEPGASITISRGEK